MIISPHYDAIKARAVALLTAPTGFNGYAAADVVSCGGYGFRNNIRVALCMARDEIELRTPRRVGRFNTGNFNRAAKEITHAMVKRQRGHRQRDQKVVT